MNKLGALITRKPLAVIILIVLITLVMGGLATTLRAEFGWATYMPDLKEAKALDEIETDFISAEVVEVVVISPDGNVLNRGSMLDILTCEQEFRQDEESEAALLEPKSQSIRSIANIIAIYSLRETTLLPSLDDQIAQISSMSDEQIGATLASYFEDPMVPQQYKDQALTMLSQQYPEQGTAEATGAFVMLDASLPEAELEDVEVRIEEIAKACAAESENSEMQVYGDQLVKLASQQSERKLVWIFGIAFAVILLICLANFGTYPQPEKKSGLRRLPSRFLNFRTISDVLISFVGLGFATIWCMGWVAILGFKLHFMNMIVPILILGLGIDYTIHVLNAYREGYRSQREVRKAVVLAIVLVGAALVLMTITTSVGFLANASSDIPPVREFGIIAAMGIISCLIIMTTFVPALRLLLDRWRMRRGKPLGLAEEHQQEKRAETGNGRLERLVKKLLRRPAIFIVVVLALTGGAAYGASQLGTGFSSTLELPQNSEAAQTIEYINEEFGFQAAEVASILIKGDIADPAMLGSVDGAIVNMADDQYVVNRDGTPLTEWILPTMHSYAQIGFDPVFTETYLQYDTDNDGRLDQPTREGIIQLFDMIYAANPSTKMMLHRDEEGRYDKLLVKAYTKTEFFKFTSELRQELEDDIAPLGARADDVVITGAPIIADLVMGGITESSVFSTLYCALATLVVVTSAFYIERRSLALGAITTIPVVLAMLWTFGTFNAVGLTLNVVTALVGALTIGLGIAYAIHISHRFSWELAQGNDPITSYRNTITNTGRSVFFSAITTAFVCAIVAATNVEVYMWFAYAGASGIIFSLIAAVVVLPVLLVLWSRRLEAKSHDS